MQTYVADTCLVISTTGVNVILGKVPAKAATFVTESLLLHTALSLGLQNGTLVLFLYHFKLELSTPLNSQL